MIQRIQTVLLFLAFASSLACFFFPVASFWGELYTIKLGALGIEEQFAYEAEWPNTIMMTVVMGLVGLLAFMTIFIYRRRPTQMKLIRFTMLLNIIYLAIIFFYYVPELEILTATTADYINEAGIYLSIVPLIFLLLALRFIRRDEKLVKAADRLR